MSVNALLNDDSSKGWSNLYVNSLTTYKDVTVKGKLKLDGEVQLGTNNGASRIFTQTYNKSGASTDNTTLVTLKFFEFGGLVTCYIPQISTTCTSNSDLILTPTIPTPDKYLPFITTTNAVRVRTGITDTLVLGNFVVETNGVIKVSPGYGPGSLYSQLKFTVGNTNVGTYENQQITYINKIANL